MLEPCASAFNKYNSGTNPNPTSNLPPSSPPSSHTYLETLRCDYHNGIPSAVAYMQGLRDYTEECRYEQEEWKADIQAEI
jgi:hypothetical protein